MSTLHAHPVSSWLLAASLCLILPARLAAQGCVPIHPDGGPAVCQLVAGAGAEPAPWELAVSYVNFRSFRHFVGREEQPQRVEQHTEVINSVDVFTVTLSRDWSPRHRLSVSLPYYTADRSSLYEHDRVNRYHTGASGAGDARVTARRWLWDPADAPKGNLALGLGLKLPTGESNAKDVFHTTAGPVYRNVDQSIQPGDGGWGVTIELSGYRRLGEGWSLYGEANYLFNPRETNGTRTTSSDPVTMFNSVPDQYLARLGATWAVPAVRGLTAALGGRWEGVPSSDLIGGSEGFRRPGYVISVEPTLTWMRGRHTVTLGVPVAIERNRVRSTVDKLRGRHGDAAFADYLLSLSYATRF